MIPSVLLDRTLSKYHMSITGALLVELGYRSSFDCMMWLDAWDYEMAGKYLQHLPSASAGHPSKNARLANS